MPNLKLLTIILKPRLPQWPKFLETCSKVEVVTNFLNTVTESLRVVTKSLKIVTQHPRVVTSFLKIFSKNCCKPF